MASGSSEPTNAARKDEYDARRDDAREEVLGGGDRGEVPGAVLAGGRESEAELAPASDLATPGDHLAPALAASAARPCGKAVYWWDGEYEGECELPVGHEGDHFDGLSWFNDDGERTDDAHAD